jgi:osmotically-inducible protein OsmY
MLLRRIARALLVAGSCGLASVALAQTGIPLPPLSQPDSARAAAGPSRLEAIKVEVALLGDPVTYAQPVEVRLENDTIILVGQVQDEATRKHILEVARQSCYLPVSDALSTVARTVGHTPAPVPLKQLARDALVRQMGSKADHFQVLTTEDGKVTLKGEVGSPEEKLAASRALRAQPGCTQVVNLLTVRTVQPGGHSIMVVSGDGQSVMTEEVRPAAPPAPKTAAGPQLLPSGLPVTRTVNVTTIHNGKEVTRPVMYVVPTTSGYATSEPVPATALTAPPPAARNCPVTTFHEGIPTYEEHDSSKKPSVLRRLFAGKNAQKRQEPAPELLTATSPLTEPPPVTEPAPSRTKKLFAKKTPPACACPQPTTVILPAQPTRPAAEPASSPKVLAPVVQTTPVLSSMVNETRPMPAETELALPAPVVQPPIVSTTVRETKPAPVETTAPATAALPTTEAWPPAHDVRPVTAAPREAIYRSRPLAGLAARTPPPPPVETVAPALAAPAPPRPMPEAKPAAPAAVTPVAAKLPPTAPAEPAAGPAPMRMTSKELIERVKSTCGKLVREVKLEPGADRQIVVHIYAKPSTEHLLVGKLLQMPELAASNVRLQLHLAN